MTKFQEKITRIMNNDYVISKDNKELCDKLFNRYVEETCDEHNFCQALQECRKHFIIYNKNWTFARVNGFLRRRNYIQRQLNLWGKVEFGGYNFSRFWTDELIYYKGELITDFKIVLAMEEKYKIELFNKGDLYYFDGYFTTRNGLMGRFKTLGYDKSLLKNYKVVSI